MHLRRVPRLADGTAHQPVLVLDPARVRVRRRTKDAVHPALALVDAGTTVRHLLPAARDLHLPPVLVRQGTIHRPPMVLTGRGLRVRRRGGGASRVRRDVEETVRRRDRRDGSRARQVAIVVLRLDATVVLHLDVTAARRLPRDGEVIVARLLRPTEDAIRTVVLLHRGTGDALIVGRRLRLLDAPEEGLLQDVEMLVRRLRADLRAVVLHPRADVRAVVRRRRRGEALAVVRRRPSPHVVPEVQVTAVAEAVAEAGVQVGVIGAAGAGRGPHSRLIHRRVIRWTSIWINASAS
ncbi:hypothetical protein EXIGLDRAFT_462435 [Exidia glandulosa HHB12029]|uniref:Uncharacterized protein n=1 Tax=Exidia glandulosa HHB12029 TaxID=1314781 RepID=A0A165K3D2_EXIGL|nr:hypothetical protein EXIGLDRAFT_462435 [Exidia glandulosa HHB12029]